MNQPSLRKTRSAVGELIGVAKQQAGSINEMRAGLGKVAQHTFETRDTLDTFLGLGFRDRLSWLLTGRLTHGKPKDDGGAAAIPPGEQVRAE